MNKRFVTNNKCINYQNDIKESNTEFIANGIYRPYAFVPFIRAKIENQIGGTNENMYVTGSDDDLYDDESYQELNGGARIFSVFRSAYKMYMLADATDQSLIK